MGKVWAVLAGSLLFAAAAVGFGGRRFAARLGGVGALDTIGVGNGPIGVSCTHVWVANFYDNTVSEIGGSQATQMIGRGGMA